MNQLSRFSSFFFICFSSFVISVHAISMSPEDYRHLILTRCYNHTERYEQLILGQTKPVGSTIDYFVSLVKKIEQKLPSFKTENIILLLLKRFHYDGLKYIGFEFYDQYSNQQIQSTRELLRRVMNEKIFQNIGNQTSRNEFPEEALTENEKCSLFYMISHTINQTLSENTPYNNEQRKIIKEFGVVSLLNNDNLGISLNNVLLGILASLVKVDPISVWREGKQLEIDPILAVTLSDKLAIASIYAIRSKSSYLFGSKGVWNSSYCQTDYQLVDESYIVTMADLNGAIDGYMIGRKIKSTSDQFLKNVKLSVLISRYYSKNGLSSDCGICQISFFPNNLIDSIRENAKNYAYFWNKNLNFDNYQNEQIFGYIETYSVQYQQFIEKSKQIKQTECSRLTNGDFANNQCETSTDLYILIDNNDHRYAKFHLEVVTRLLIKLKSLDYLGKVSILVNALKGFDSEQISTNFKDLKVPLHLIVYNASAPQEATCRLAWYNYRETTINNKKLLLNYMVNFFEQDNITNIEKGRSKNLVWFSLKDRTYEKMIDRERIFYYQYRWYLLYYLNLRIFFLSSYEFNFDDDLKNMILNKDDWFHINPTDYYDETIVNRLAQRMCETPIAVRVDECESDRVSNQAISEDHFISINRKQYWALYPKYFLHSSSVQLKFKSESAPIRVCLDRWKNPENNRTTCQEAENKEIEFNIKNPCRWNTIESCQAIYFTVSISKKNIDSSSPCLDSRCKSFDQVRWTLQYSGLVCSFTNLAKPLHSDAFKYFVIFSIILKIFI